MRARSSRFAEAGLLGLVFACAPLPAERAASPQAPMVLDISPSSGAMPVEVASVADEPSSACRLETKDYEASPQGWTLRLSDGQTTWGFLRPRAGGAASIWLEGEHGRAMRYRFRGDGFLLEGQVASDSVTLYSREPVWFARVGLLRPDVALPWVKARGSKIALTLELGNGFRPMRLTTELRCGEVILEEPDDDLAGVIDEEATQTWQIVGDAPLALWPSAEGGRTELSLVDHGGETLGGGEERAGRRRVIYHAGELVVLAWVDASRLKLPTAMTARGVGVGGGGFGVGALGTLGKKRKRRDLRCSFPLPLSVAVGGQREVVGRLEPRRAFWVDDLEAVEAGHRRLHFEEAPVGLSMGARWTAEASALDGCSTP